MFINKVHNACRSSGNLQEVTSSAWDVVGHLLCRGSRILVCGSCSILIWSIEEGSSPLLPQTMFESLIGCQKCYTGILNDPVPQDYTRDIPDI